MNKVDCSPAVYFVIKPHSLLQKGFKMQIYDYTHKAEYFISKILNKYLGDMRLGVFDIETLGLYPKYNPMVLAGVMGVSADGECSLRQLFAESIGPEEERLLLEALEDELSRFDCILTYNGRYFDIPYVRERAAKLGFSDYPIRPFNIDLLLFLRHYSGLREALGSLKQKNVERYMGLAPSREDEISGSDSVMLYKEFEKCTDENKKAALREKILLHNHDDLLQLYKILPVILQTDIHGAMNKLGFPVKGEQGWDNLHIKSIKVTSGGLSVMGTYCGQGLSFRSFATHERPYSCVFDIDRSFTIELPMPGLKAQLTNPMEINELAKALLVRFMEDNPRILSE